MPLYTGCVDQGFTYKKSGRIRVLTVSRLSDELGKNPRDDLWKGVSRAGKSEFSFDLWNPQVAPLGRDVASWYQSKIDWDEFSRRYHANLYESETYPFLYKLVEDAMSQDQKCPESGLVIQCVCNLPPGRKTCHRFLLAEEVQKLAFQEFTYHLEIVHL